MKSDGFTLTELLLSVGIITMITTMSIPVYATFQSRNELDITAQQVANLLRRAQTYSRGVRSDSTWGVAIQTTTATLFKGSTYDSRDSNFDEIITIPGNTTSSGLNQVTFTKLFAAPSTTGTITLTNPNETRTVTLNAEGMVEY